MEVGEGMARDESVILDIDYVIDGDTYKHRVLGLGMGNRMVRTIARILSPSRFSSQNNVVLFCCTAPGHNYRNPEKDPGIYENENWLQFAKRELYIGAVLRGREKRRQKEEAKGRATDSKALDEYVPLLPYDETVEHVVDIAANWENEIDPTTSRILLYHDPCFMEDVRETMIPALLRMKQQNQPLAYAISWIAAHSVELPEIRCCEFFGGDMQLTIAIAVLIQTMCYPLNLAVLEQLARTLHDDEDVKELMLPIYTACIFSPHISDRQACEYIQHYRRMFYQSPNNRRMWTWITYEHFYLLHKGYHPTLHRLNWWVTYTNFYPNPNDGFGFVQLSKYGDEGLQFIQVCCAANPNRTAADVTSIIVEVCGMDAEEVPVSIPEALKMYSWGIEDMSSQYIPLTRLLDTVSRRDPEHPGCAIIRNILVEDEQDP